MRTRLTPLRLFISAMAGCVVAAMPTIAAAEVIVLAAKGAAIKAGDTLGDGVTIDLPAGASVEVLLPSGAMRTLTGPSKTPVRTLTKGEKADAGLFGKVAELVAKSGGSESAVGAVRSAAVTRAAKPLPFSWRNIPIDADGDWCVEKGADLSLVRAPSDRGQRVTLVDVQGTQRVEISFEPGKTTVNWPQDLAPKIGTYALLIADRPMKQIKLRLVSPIPAREDTLRVLHGQRCEIQMRAFLGELTQVAGR